MDQNICEKCGYEIRTDFCTNCVHPSIETSGGNSGIHYIPASGELSTPLTLASKISLPIFCVIGIILWVYMLATEKIGESAILFFVLAVAMCFQPLYLTFKAKRVWLKDDKLTIKGIKKEIIVSLNEVSDFSGGIPFNPAVVVMHLNKKTTFGKKIIFIGRFHFWGALFPHPIIYELKDLLKKEV